MEYIKAVTALVPEDGTLAGYFIMRAFFKIENAKITLKAKNAKIISLSQWDGNGWRATSGNLSNLNSGELVLLRCEFDEIGRKFVKLEGTVRITAFGREKTIKTEDTWRGGKKLYIRVEESRQYIKIIRIHGLEDEFNVSVDKCNDVDYVKKIGRDRILIKFHDNPYRIWKAHIRIYPREENTGPYAFSMCEYDHKSWIPLFVDSMDEEIDDRIHEIKNRIFSRIDCEVDSAVIQPRALKEAIDQIVKKLEIVYYPYFAESATYYSGTPFKYYNPHDFQHAKRVVYASFRVADLLGLLDELNIYELIILYLAAWLHDVGMTQHGLVSGYLDYDTLRIRHSIKSMEVSEEILTSFSHIFEQDIIELIKVVVWAHSGRLYTVIQDINQIMKKINEIKERIYKKTDPRDVVESLIEDIEHMSDEGSLRGLLLFLMEMIHSNGIDILGKQLVEEIFKKIVERTSRIDKELLEKYDLPDIVNVLFFMVFGTDSKKKFQRIFGVKERNVNEYISEYLSTRERLSKPEDMRERILPRPKKASPGEIEEIIESKIPKHPVSKWTKQGYIIKKDHIVKIAAIIRFADMLDNSRLRRIRNANIIGEALAYAFCGLKNFETSLKHYIIRDMCREIYILAEKKANGVSLYIDFRLDISRAITLSIREISKRWEYKNFLGDPGKCCKPLSPSFYADIFDELSFDMTKKCNGVKKDFPTRDILKKYNISIAWKYTTSKFPSSQSSPEIRMWENIARKILETHSCTKLAKMIAGRRKIDIPTMLKYIDIRAVSGNEIKVTFNRVFLDELQIHSIAHVISVTGEPVEWKIEGNNQLIIRCKLNRVNYTQQARKVLIDLYSPAKHIQFYVALCYPVPVKENNIIRIVKYLLPKSENIPVFFPQPTENIRIEIMEDSQRTVLYDKIQSSATEYDLSKNGANQGLMTIPSMSTLKKLFP